MIKLQSLTLVIMGNNKGLKYLNNIKAVILPTTYTACHHSYWFTKRQIPTWHPIFVTQTLSLFIQQIFPFSSTFYYYNLFNNLFGSFTGKRVTTHESSQASYQESSFDTGNKWVYAVRVSRLKWRRRS